MLQLLQANQLICKELFNIYFKDGKLNGKWTSYDANGTIKAIAEYTNGEKSGKWIFSDAIASKEVAFSNNQIITVNSKVNAIANKN